MSSLRERHSASFRDPSGHLFFENGNLFRSVASRYQPHYDCLMRSGLYQSLVDDELLIPHNEVVPTDALPNTYKILQPVMIPQISYPYEWCFSQLKDAALTTLEIQKRALDHGMILKDASAFNIQFFKGKPVFIDTLSFEIYNMNQPWTAYRQFCQHFLAPLSLMACRDVRLGHLLRTFIDGPPLDLVSALLPFSTRLKPSLLSHIHLHAKTQKRYESKPARQQHLKVTEHSLKALIHHLYSTVQSLKWRPGKTEWGDYYENTNYSGAAMDHKKKLVKSFLAGTAPRTVWDLGANTGEFSRIASDENIFTIAFDIDPSAVELNYQMVRMRKETHLLPLCMDLTNPSPGLGWAHTERQSLCERGPADTVLALALVHHLAISNNLPFDCIASFLSRLCRFLIIEFIPKNDSQVQRMLLTRDDIFDDYTQENFTAAFQNHFSICETETVSGTQRTLYLMQNRTPSIQSAPSDSND